MIIKVPVPNPATLYDDLLQTSKWLNAFGLRFDLDFNYGYYSLDNRLPGEIHFWFADDRGDIALLLVLRGL